MVGACDCQRINKAISGGRASKIRSMPESWNELNSELLRPGSEAPPRNPWWEGTAPDDIMSVDMFSACDCQRINKAISGGRASKIRSMPESWNELNSELLRPGSEAPPRNPWWEGTAPDDIMSVDMVGACDCQRINEAISGGRASKIGTS